MKLLNAAIIQYVDKKNRVFRHESNKGAYYNSRYHCIPDPSTIQTQCGTEERFDLIIVFIFIFRGIDQSENSKRLELLI